LICIVFWPYCSKCFAAILRVLQSLFTSVLHSSETHVCRADAIVATSTSP